MKKHLLNCTAALVVTAALGACSSTPSTEETSLSAQPVRSAPFELVTSDLGPMVTLEDLQFDFEQASLRPEAYGIIKQTADYLRANENRIALVEGHTDHTGKANYNVMLSDARSNAVAQALIDAGIAPERIQTRGLGETQPVASNSTPDGRQRNRRVEIILQKANDDSVISF